MPRPKKQPAQNPTILPLANYDTATLLSALQSFEHSIGWEVFKDFVYGNAVMHGIASNQLIQQSGRQFEACAAGAKSEILREMITLFINQLKERLQGNEGIVESHRPEEEK